MDSENLIRLQKFLSLSGVASRRKSEEYIINGRVMVNGKIVTELGTKVSSLDIVLFDNKRIEIEESKVYIMLNKPVGFVTTSKDQFNRKTVLDLVKIEKRIYPVGRLDYNSSGLLILTNDGDFAYKMTHPKKEIWKLYNINVLGNPKEDDIQKLRDGIEIDGYLTQKCKIKVLEKSSAKTNIEIQIKEGRNRQIRKMFSTIGHEVLTLNREKIGSLLLGDLKVSEWRYINKLELEELQCQF